MRLCTRAYRLARRRWRVAEPERRGRNQSSAPTSGIGSGRLAASANMAAAISRPMAAGHAEIGADRKPARDRGRKLRSLIGPSDHRRTDRARPYPVVGSDDGVRDVPGTIADQASLCRGTIAASRCSRVAVLPNASCVAYSGAEQATQELILSVETVRLMRGSELRPFGLSCNDFLSPIEPDHCDHHGHLNR